MAWIISIICIIITIICLIKISKKQIIDKTEQEKYINEIASLKEQKEQLQKTTILQQREIEKEQQRLNNFYQQNEELFARKTAELDQFYTTTRAQRLEQLTQEISERENTEKELLQNRLNEYKKELDKNQKLYEDILDAVVNDFNLQVAQIQSNTEFQQERFNHLLAPLQQYEKDRQAKLFYTIQVPDEYKSDIDFLLTQVSSKVQHPDIINKLIWTEYVKPYIDETFKRVDIKSEPGIYKLTNINDGKSYIGKSTDIKKRISDHFKSSVGIKNIADQAVHHAILKTGFWNWAIECIIYCDKEKLNELEKYYIAFFNTQKFGYNKTEGG